MNVFTRDHNDDVDSRLAMIRVGDSLRLARGRAGITLRALARQLDLSAPFLSDLEHGRRRMPRPAEFEKALGLKAGHFAEIAGVCSKCMGSGVVEPKKRGSR